METVAFKFFWRGSKFQRESLRPGDVRQPCMLCSPPMRNFYAVYLSRDIGEAFKDFMEKPRDGVCWYLCRKCARSNGPLW